MCNKHVATEYIKTQVHPSQLTHDSGTSICKPAHLYIVDKLRWTA